MPTTIESSGKTLDEAIRSGLSVLGVEREAVTVEILSKPKTGFFGIGSTLAKVKLTLTAPEKSAKEPIRTERPAAPQQQQQKPVQANQPRPQRPANAAPQPRPQRPVQAAPAATVQPIQPVSSRPAPASRRTVITATDADYKKATEFIDGFLKYIDMGMTASSNVNDGVIHINIEGENVGNLIGRHGETLDAIQHIVTNVVNLKNDGVTVRVQVDAADYRSKRQSALEQLAVRMADNAKKYNSNMTLEPMNAYERHIIHVALQDAPGIVTFSTGSEPQRRVVISSSNAQRRRSADRRPTRDDNRPPHESESNRSRPTRDGNRPLNEDNRSRPTRDGNRPPYENNRTRPPRDDRFSRDNNHRSSNDNHGHTNSTRPASQAFRSASDDTAQNNIPTPPPRTLPVKEFGVKKS